jgi:hypothetical protein
LTNVFQKPEPLSIKVKLTSQQEFAIWQPAWPTVQNVYVSTICDEVEDVELSGVQRVKGVPTVDADDFSHICFD